MPTRSTLKLPSYKSRLNFEDRYAKSEITKDEFERVKDNFGKL